MDMCKVADLPYLSTTHSATSDEWRWIDDESEMTPNDVGVRLMSKVGSLRTEDAAQDENVAETSCLIQNWRLRTYRN
jgi:hypothetical protein